MSEFWREFAEAVRTVEDESWKAGRLGIRENSLVSFHVTGRPNFVYVRRGMEGELGIIQARNDGCVLRYDLPVLVRQEHGEWVCRTDGSRLASFGDVGAVGPHTHAERSGLEYEVPAKWLQPGRVRPLTGMTVKVNDFFYYYQGDTKYYAGENLDLTANKPVTAGHWRWVVVCMNPATNTAIAVNGTSQSTSVPLDKSAIAAIAIGDYLPLGGVRVKNSDTKLGDITRYEDAHEWFNRGGVSAEEVQDIVGAFFVDSADLDVTYDDAGNTISAIVKDDAITFAKMQNVSTGIVLGRFTAATGNLEELSENLFILASGQNPLTANWDVGEDMVILTEKITARDAEGLTLFDDGGFGAVLQDDGTWVLTRNGAGHILTMGTNTLTEGAITWNSGFRMQSATRHVYTSIQDNTGQAMYSGGVAGEAFKRVLILADGHFQLGGGAAAVDTELFRLSASLWKTTDSMVIAGTLGVGLDAALGKVHVDQSSTTAAIPVLILDQADLSEEFIRFVATVGAGNPIDTAALGTYYGKVRVYVEGVGAKFIPLYNS